MESVNLKLKVLGLNDCSCPICFEILIEPVKTPCDHELCLSCLNQMYGAQNYACPICRNDMSKVLKSSPSNLQNFVNKKRWEEIQVIFPREIENRRENKTAQLIAQSIATYEQTGEADATYQSIFTSSDWFTPSKSLSHNLAEPGELHNYWVEWHKKEKAKLQTEMEEEEELSRIEIERILREESVTNKSKFGNVVPRIALQGTSSATEVLLATEIDFDPEEQLTFFPSPAPSEFDFEAELIAIREQEMQLSLAEVDKILREDQLAEAQNEINITTAAALQPSRQQSTIKRVLQKH